MGSWAELTLDRPTFGFDADAPEGDLFGLRPGGLSMAKLRKRPHGVVLDDSIPTGVLREKVRHTPVGYNATLAEEKAEMLSLAATPTHEMKGLLR